MCQDVLALLLHYVLVQIVKQVSHSFDFIADWLEMLPISNCCFLN